MKSDQLENYSVPGTGNFSFSAVSPSDLEELGYTVATVVLDQSGSLEYKKDLLVELLKVIAQGLKKSSRAETILLRVIAFNETISEIHGFKPVSQIDPAIDYQGIDPDGMRPLLMLCFRRWPLLMSTPRSWKRMVLMLMRASMLSLMAWIIAHRKRRKTFLSNWQR